MKKRFTEAQIVGFLREADAGVAVKDLCRKHGFSEGSYYVWRSKFGGMSVSDAKRLKELEVENTRLKKLLADSLLETRLPAKPSAESGDRTSAPRPGAEHDRTRPQRATGPRRDRHEGLGPPGHPGSISQCRPPGRALSRSRTGIGAMAQGSFI